MRELVLAYRSAISVTHLVLRLLTISIPNYDRSERERFRCIPRKTRPRCKPSHDATRPTRLVHIFDTQAVIGSLSTRSRLAYEDMKPNILTLGKHLNYSPVYNGAEVFGGMHRKRSRSDLS